VVFGTTYEPLIDEATPGHRVLINDGLIRLLAIERASDGSELLCRVIVGGLVTSGKGINLPESELSAPAISERDWQCVTLGGRELAGLPGAVVRAQARRDPRAAGAPGEGPALGSPARM
jgi:hypothetical protein